MDRTRRTFLQRGAGLLSVGYAGCLADVEFGDDGADSGYAAFFTLEDWATQVGGELIEFENPIGVGEMGHGWEHDGDLAREIAGTDVFVYLDTPEFSWAQNIADQLETDYDTIEIIDGMERLHDHLLPWDGDDENDNDHDENDDHGFYDPHVWVDPVLSQIVVETIADGLATIDPNNADTYAENAEAYNSQLAAIDHEFESLVEDAERDVAVLAGHDSFQYLEHRYGFELHTPAGASPESESSPSELGDTIEFVDEHGIDVVLYDHFEGSSDAETIVENSDATDVAPVSPTEGTTAEWNELGWGYADQMREINLLAFRKALGGE